MHAYLLVGRDGDTLNEKAKAIADQEGAMLLIETVQKIADIRNLQSYLKLALNKKTFFLIKRVDLATPETLNAFLKNLEEPQSKAGFILTTKSVHKVLDTVVSRCQVVSLENEIPQKAKEAADNFLKMAPHEKLKYFDKAKKKEESLEILEELLEGMAFHLHTDSNKLKTAKTVKELQKTYLALTANGNPSLQTTALVVKLEN